MAFTKAQARKWNAAQTAELQKLPRLEGDRLVALLSEMHAVERALRELGDARQRCAIAREDRRIGAQMTPLFARLAAIRDELGVQVPS